MFVLYALVLNSFVFLKCALANEGTLQFAKLNTNVELKCPYPINMSTWAHSSGSFIAIFGTTNSSTDQLQKYNFKENKSEHTLIIHNFSDDDEGRYRCQMNNNNTVIDLLLCRIPQQVKLLMENIQTSMGPTFGYPNGLICNRKVQTEISTEEHQSRKIIFKADDNETELFEESVRFECEFINKEFCSLNKTVMTTGIFTVYNVGGADVLSFTCTCNDTSCNESMVAFKIKNTLYFSSWRKSSQESLVCVLSNIMNNRTGQVRISVYVGIVASGALVMVFAVVLCRHIKGYRSKEENIENNQDNDVIPGPSNSLHNEEYSSIERRQQITLGQVVSFAVCSSQNQPKAICNNGNSGLSCQGHITKRQSETSQISTSYKTSVEHNLNYTCISFNNETCLPNIIIGDDRRTPYADIDLTMKADPLPESDSSGDEHEDNRDFMTLEEMQSLINVKTEKCEDDC